MTVNGGPGALALDPDGLLLAVWALDVTDGGIRGVASMVNPDKLRHIGEVGSMRDALDSLSRRRRRDAGPRSP